jgi:hypothetical protein
MRSPPSTFENRTYGAEKIGSGRYSDFFNRIGQFLPRHLTERAAALPPESSAATATDWRVGLSNKLNLCCASHPMISEQGDPREGPVRVEKGDRQCNRQSSSARSLSPVIRPASALKTPSGGGSRRSPSAATRHCRTSSPRSIPNASTAICRRPSGCSCSTITGQKPTVMLSRAAAKHR